MDRVSIRLARAGDLDSIWALVRRSIVQMNAQGNGQWGEDYPTRADYEADLSRGELYAAGLDGVLAGAACINTCQNPEYAPLPWGTEGDALVIHRMAVDPACRRQGVGGALFRFAQEEALRRKLAALRVDTYEGNRQMRGLILRQGFRPVGVVHFPARPPDFHFLCFEKPLGPFSKQGGS